MWLTDQNIKELNNFNHACSYQILHTILFQSAVTFEITYNAPDGSVGLWQEGGFEHLKSDDLRRGLTEEEMNSINSDRRASASDSVTSNSSIRGSRISLLSKTSGGGKSTKRWVLYKGDLWIKWGFNPIIRWKDFHDIIVSKTVHHNLLPCSVGKGFYNLIVLYGCLSAAASLYLLIWIC